MINIRNTLVGIALFLTAAMPCQSQMMMTGIGPGSAGGVGVQGSTYNFVANTATVNGVAQPSSTSSLTDTRSTIGYDLAATTKFAVNTPKRTSAGLLIEPAITNNIVQSQAFNNASWTATNTTVVDNSTTAPDGTTTAALITATGTSSTELHSTAYSASNGVAYVASAFMKPGSIGNWIYVGVGDDAAVACAAYFDIVNSVVGTIQSTGGTTALVTITPVGNGWVRVVIVFSFASNRSPFIQFRMTTANNGLFANLAGQNMYIWGAQVVPATVNNYSYYPTTTAAATSSADAPILTTASNAATATITFSDNTTQTIAVDPQNNTLNLSPSILNETLLTSINIPAPVTSYVGAISDTSISYNSGATLAYISCKYTADPFKVSVPWFKIRVPAWYLEYISSTYTETNNPQALIEKWSVEYPAGTFTPISFSGVSTGSTLTPGTDLVSDQINVTIPSGASPNLWLFGQNPSSGMFPALMFPAGASTSVCNQSATPNDQTDTGGTVTSNALGMGPSAIIGPTSQPSVLSIGDSRTRVNGGEIASTLAANNIAYIQAGTFGDQAAYYATRSLGYRTSLQVDVSHVAVGYGVNDLNAGTTDASLRSFMLSIGNSFKTKPTFISTIEASTTSSDGWTTLSGQSTTIASGALETQNTWRRTVPTPYIGIWDVAAQTGQIFGGFLVWNVPGFTTDGVHASTTGISAIVSSGVVNTSNLRMWLLKRDIDPASNDNDPMWLEKAA